MLLSRVCSEVIHTKQHLAVPGTAQLRTANKGASPKDFTTAAGDFCTSGYAT